MYAYSIITNYYLFLFFSNNLQNMSTILFTIAVLKLLKMAKGIRALLDTVIQALPQVGNLGLLFFLLFFIFAALGVELFGRLGMCSFVFFYPVHWCYYPKKNVPTSIHAPASVDMRTLRILEWLSWHCFE